MRNSMNEGVGCVQAYVREAQGKEDSSDCETEMLIILLLERALHARLSACQPASL